MDARRIALPFVESDGGRAAAGFKGHAGDCACRALAIATLRPYREVYDLILHMGLRERGNTNRPRSHPRTGVWMPTFQKAASSQGFFWMPTKIPGSSRTVHMAQGEIPAEGRLICRLSRHYCAVIDGVVHDTYDPSRGGNRMVYGYWRLHEGRE